MVSITIRQIAGGTSQKRVGSVIKRLLRFHAAPRVVDQNIEAAEAVDRCGRGALAVFLLGHVGNDG